MDIILLIVAIITIISTYIGWHIYKRFDLALASYARMKAIQKNIPKVIMHTKPEVIDKFDHEQKRYLATRAEESYHNEITPIQKISQQDQIILDKVFPKKEFKSYLLLNEIQKDFFNATSCHYGLLTPWKMKERTVAATNLLTGNDDNFKCKIEKLDLIIDADFSDLIKHPLLAYLKKGG